MSVSFGMLNFPIAYSKTATCILSNLMDASFKTSCLKTPKSSMLNSTHAKKESSHRNLPIAL